ncbi:hypothetical protein KAR91_81760 [Candidatus Pacearchaeota archaeon]|nr:hypothetical protein [Candidatus Pacearchaeota archaeon]
MTTWEGIHRELFCTKEGKPVISLSTLRAKHGPGLRASGVVFLWNSGSKCKRPIIAGWRSKIISYFTKLGQLEDAERVKRKADKKRLK